MSINSPGCMFCNKISKITILFTVNYERADALVLVPRSPEMP